MPSARPVLSPWLERMRSHGGPPHWPPPRPRSFSTSSGILSSIFPTGVSAAMTRKQVADRGCWEKVDHSQCPWTHQVSLHLSRWISSSLWRHQQLRPLNFLSSCSLSLGSLMLPSSVHQSADPRWVPRCWNSSAELERGISLGQLARVLTQTQHHQGQHQGHDDSSRWSTVAGRVPF